MCRLIVDPPAPGTWNMAVDEALLDGGRRRRHRHAAVLPVERAHAFARLFPAIRRSRHRTPPAATARVVRRQSGGGAILHDRELTYSLTLPPDHPLTRDATALYTAVHNAFVELLSPRLPQIAAELAVSR